MFGNEKITKIIKIEGMSCMNCAKKVEEGLKTIKGVKSVQVDLENKVATVTMKEEIENGVFKNIIEELGYEVVEIK